VKVAPPSSSSPSSSSPGEGGGGGGGSKRYFDYKIPEDAEGMLASCGRPTTTAQFRDLLRSRTYLLLLFQSLFFALLWVVQWRVRVPDMALTICSFFAIFIVAGAIWALYMFRRVNPVNYIAFAVVHFFGIPPLLLFFGLLSPQFLFEFFWHYSFVLFALFLGSSLCNSTFDTKRRRFPTVLFAVFVWAGAAWLSFWLQTRHALLAVLLGSGTLLRPHDPLHTLTANGSLAAIILLLLYISYYPCFRYNAYQYTISCIDFNLFALPALLRNSCCGVPSHDDLIAVTRWRTDPRAAWTIDHSSVATNSLSFLVVSLFCTSLLGEILLFYYQQ
jgi:hypothetical protein